MSSEKMSSCSNRKTDYWPAWFDFIRSEAITIIAKIRRFVDPGEKSVNVESGIVVPQIAAVPNR